MSSWAGAKRRFNALDEALASGAAEASSSQAAVALEPPKKKVSLFAKLAALQADSEQRSAPQATLPPLPYPPAPAPLPEPGSPQPGRHSGGAASASQQSPLQQHKQHHGPQRIRGAAGLAASAPSYLDFLPKLEEPSGVALKHWNPRYRGVGEEQVLDGIAKDKAEQARVKQEQAQEQLEQDWQQEQEQQEEHDADKRLGLQPGQNYDEEHDPDLLWDWDPIASQAARKKQAATAAATNRSRPAASGHSSEADGIGDDSDAADASQDAAPHAAAGSRRRRVHAGDRSDAGVAKRGSGGGGRSGRQRISGGAAALRHGDDAGPSRRSRGGRSGSGAGDGHSHRGTGQQRLVRPLGAAGSDAQPLMLKSADGRLQLQVPASLNSHLRDYQRQGVQFLFQQYSNGVGGILADDMGLGKTVQTIAFLSALLGKTGDDATDSRPRSFPDTSPAALTAMAARNANGVVAGSGVLRWPLLVVCPTSVLANWQREFELWGTFQVGLYHGTSDERSHVLHQAAHGTLEVVITSYGLLRLHQEALFRVPWHAAVFDEAHKLKNKDSKTYEAAALVPTRMRYGLSGTIMQNEHKELYYLMDWVVPGCLGPKKEFMQYYAEPMKMGQRVGASKWELATARERTTELLLVLDRLRLGRTKNIIAHQLPTKTDHVVFCELRPLQYAAYRRTVQTPDLQLLVRAQEPCDCGSGLTRAKCCHWRALPEDGGVLWPRYHMCECDDELCLYHRPDGCEENRCPWCIMLPALQLLRKISNHLELMKPDLSMAQAFPLQFEYAVAQAEMVLGEDADRLGGLTAGGAFLNTSSTEHCGKMAVLEQLLGMWQAENAKVLLFSHSTRMLDIIQHFIIRQGYEFVRLDGSTPQKQRQAYVDDFNHRSSLFIFLISTSAGGLGLNLTSANKVVIFDPSWNPARDLQAQDRAFRIGQMRDVEVYRLVGTGTLEEQVYRRQVYKQQQANVAVAGNCERRMFEGVQHKKGLEGELWGIANLLRFHEGSVETADIVQSYERRHASGPSTSQGTAGAAAAPAGDATEAAAPAGGATGAAGPSSSAAAAAAAAAANPGTLGGRGVKMEIVLLDENAYLPPAPAGDDDASDDDGEGLGRSRRGKKGSSGRGAGGGPGAAWDEDAGMCALVQELLQEEDIAGAAGTTAAGAAGAAGTAAAGAAGTAGAGPATMAGLAGAAAAAPPAAPLAAAAADGDIRSAATTQALTVSPAAKQAAHDIIVISDDDDTVCSSSDDDHGDPDDEAGVVASAATPVMSPQQGAVSMLRARGVILHMQRHDMIVGHNTLEQALGEEALIDKALTDALQQQQQQQQREQGLAQMAAAAVHRAPRGVRPITHKGTKHTFARLAVQPLEQGTPDSAAPAVKHEPHLDLSALASSNQPVHAAVKQQQGPQHEQQQQQQQQQPKARRKPRAMKLGVPGVEQEVLAMPQEARAAAFESAVLSAAFGPLTIGCDALASLAAWRGVGAVQLARQIVGMEDADREALMQEYAAERTERADVIAVL